MALFKVLANDTRIRMLHHIVRSGEATVTDLAKTLGMKPQAVSNQLMRLSDTGMLVLASRGEQRVLPGRERLRRRRSSTWPSASWKTRDALNQSNGERDVKVN